MTVWIVGEPLEVHASKGGALRALVRRLRDELPLIRNGDMRWAVAAALEVGEAERAIRLWMTCSDADRPRLRFEEHEVRESP
jgi:hypothetical protein